MCGADDCGLEVEVWRQRNLQLSAFQLAFRFAHPLSKKSGLLLRQLRVLPARAGLYSSTSVLPLLPLLCSSPSDLSARTSLLLPLSRGEFELGNVRVRAPLLLFVYPFARPVSLSSFFFLLVCFHLDFMFSFVAGLRSTSCLSLVRYFCASVVVLDFFCCCAVVVVAVASLVGRWSACEPVALERVGAVLKTLDMHLEGLHNVSPFLSPVGDHFTHVEVIGASISRSPSCGASNIN